MKAYSIDLRQKILDAYHSTPISQSQLAKRFSVALRTSAKIRKIKVEDLIFIDEAGVNLAMVRLYARSLRGQRARGTLTT